MKGSQRISYPLLSPILPKNTARTVLVRLCKLRGKKMWVERRRTTTVVLLLVGIFRKGLWWGTTVAVYPSLPVGDSCSQPPP